MGATIMADEAKIKFSCCLLRPIDLGRRFSQIIADEIKIICEYLRLSASNFVLAGQLLQLP